MRKFGVQTEVIMKLAVSVVLIVCGTCLAGMMSVRSMFLDSYAMKVISEGGRIDFTSGSLPEGYAWAVFWLGAIMILLGVLTCFRHRDAS